jgi:thiol:disulfide interchange protein
MRFIKLLCISIIAVVMIVFFFGDKEPVKPTNPAVGHATTNVTNLVLNNCRNHTADWCLTHIEHLFYNANPGDFSAVEVALIEANVTNNVVRHYYK